MTFLDLHHHSTSDATLTFDDGLERGLGSADDILDDYVILSGCVCGHADHTERRVTDAGLYVRGRCLFDYFVVMEPGRRGRGDARHVGGEGECRAAACLQGALVSRFDVDNRRA